MTTKTLISCAAFTAATGTEMEMDHAATYGHHIEGLPMSFAQIEAQHAEHIVKLDNLMQQFEHHIPIMEKWPSMTLHEQLEHMAKDNPVLINFGL